ncbi:MAG: PaaX family transcriptional regulator [Streptosporangiales bacterium]|nr:PaaX family transcriptional regulator [Streptosporangiales bacterium]
MTQGYDSRSSGNAHRARPAFSRRDIVGETSARSLLLTVLGEFVLRQDEPAWTAAIVAMLGRLGVEEKSARQALSRTAAEGWLESERVGRSVRWSLTAPGRRLLTDGAERIYSFGTSTPGWDGSWLVLYVSVPEAKRKLRHRLRTRLSWAGFGSPEPGMWISPHPGRRAEADGIIEDLGLHEQAMSFTGPFGGIGNEQTMVDRAWDIAGIEARYERFIDEFTGMRPAQGDSVLLAQTRLVHEWRRFPFLDPQLPQKLLPAHWSGRRAAALFHDKHAAWDEGARRRWRELAAS